MGYRSQVIVAVKKSLLKDNSEILQLLMESDEASQTKTMAYFLFHDAKWYEHYPSNQKIENFIADNEEYCAIVRIGEDYGDIQEIGNTYDLGLRIERYAHIEFETKPYNPKIKRAVKVLHGPSK